MNWLHDLVSGAAEGWALSWLGEHEDTETFPGDGPAGVGSLALELEQGYAVVSRWPTRIGKARSGLEQRVSRNDHAKESYAGEVMLLNDAPVSVRATLARIAAAGEPILLGLPHEAMSIRADSTGTTVPVSATSLSLCDWKNSGQRVQVVRNRQKIDAVIQSTTTNTITLDVEPGVIGRQGGFVMPAVPVYLEPEQVVARYRTNVERWMIKARAVSFDFAAELPSLALGDTTVTLPDAFVTLRSKLYARVDFAMDGDAGYPAAGWFVEVLWSGVPLVLFGYQPGVTTVQDLADALASSVYVNLTGTYTGADVLQAGDEVGESILNVGDSGPVGTGATLTTYADRPVWDRPIKNTGTIADGIHAMTKIVDYDGIPQSVGFADAADWPRAVVFHGQGDDDRQWLKLFMVTVVGAQKAFWLPTYRNDLPFVSKATDTITVVGDVPAFYPAQRQHLHIRETNGTITRAEITGDAVDNGDGTWTLTIGTTLATSSVEMVSWLELCRFESEEITVTYSNGASFLMSTTARGVQR